MIFINHYIANVKAYDYKQVALDSLAVTQQLSLISLLLIVFYHMINNHLDPYSLIMINTIMCIIGFMIWIYSSYSMYIYLILLLIHHLLKYR